MKNLMRNLLLVAFIAATFAKPQIFGGSSSSSSSSSSGNGPTYFQNSSTFYGNESVIGVTYGTSGVITPNGNVYYQQSGYPISG
jgi:hypothetical protein